MSVTIHYFGNCGNNMFQYFAGLIYAHKHNLQLATLPTNQILSIIKINAPIYTQDTNLKEFKITDSNFDENNELKYYGKQNYIFSSYFQNSHYFNNNIAILKQYVSLYDLPYIINENDILLIVRLGDFKHQGYNSEILHPEYYLNILSQKEYNSIYFLIYPQNDPNIDLYMNYFNQYKNKIKFFPTRNEQFDFNISGCFKNVATSNSTFNWWSCFFNVEKITNLYTPKNMGYFGIKTHKNHGLHIKDLDNIRERSISIDHKFINLSDTLFDLSKKYGTDKYQHGYIYVYERLFVNLREKQLKILEIGVREGHSHLMWRDYFFNSQIYGIDNLTDNPLETHHNFSNIHLYIGDQTDEKFLNEKFKEPLDIIIDDGGHKMSHQQISLKVLFKTLKSGGYYIIEDLHTSNVPLGHHFMDVPDLQYSTLNFLKNIMSLSDSYFIKSNDLKYIQDNIDSIDICVDNKLCIIRKK